MNCQYLFKDNFGNLIELNSEEELGSFILNNKHRLKGINYDPLLNYSKDFKAQDEKYALLLDLASKTKLDDDAIDEYGEKILKRGDYMSVTRAITSKELFGSETNFKELVTGFNKDAYFEFEIERLSKSINPDTNANYTEDEIKNYLTTLENNWKKLGQLGTAIHTINEIFFNDTTLTKQQVLDLYSKRPESKVVNLDRAALDSCFNYVTSIHKNLLSLFPEAKFIPELKLRTTDNSPVKLVGKIDLLVIDKDGNVHIFDFKASPKHYTEYKQVKKITFEYQLAFYRQMLAQHGIPISKTRLGILPIQMMDIDYDQSNFRNLKEEADVDFQTGETARGYQSLIPGVGYIAKKVEMIVPVDAISFEANTQTYEELDRISKEMFGFNPEDKGVRSIKKIEEFTPNKNGKYWFIDSFTGKYYEADSKENIKKEYDEYLKRSEGKKLHYTQDVLNKFNDAKAKGEKVFDPNSPFAQKYNYYYGKYLREGYEVNDSFIGTGVLIFTHPVFKTVDFIYITSEDISTPVTTLAYGSNGTKLTGNLIPDRKAPKEIMDANVGNIELIRLAAVANQFMAGLNGEYKLQDFQVINNDGRKMAYLSTDNIIRNFTILVNEVNKKLPKEQLFENNFTKYARGRTEIETIAPETKLLNTIDAILSQDSHLLSLKPVRTKVDALTSLNNNEEKILKLIEVIEQIKNIVIGDSKYGSSSGNILDPVKNDNFRESPLSLVYYMAHEALREMSGLNFEYQFSDISRWSPHSELLAPAQLSSIRIINEVQDKIIDKARGKITKELHLEFGKIKVYSEQYLRDNGNIDSSLNAFDQIIISEQSGTDIIFRTKDPEKDIMFDHLKEFLTKWLETINSIRYPHTGGDRNHPEAQELIKSGEWFNIPLRRGGVVNRGISGIKDNITDFLDKVKKPLETLSEMQKVEEKFQADRFDYYLNPLAIEGQERDNLLSSKGVDYFSRDLAEIAIEYQYNATTKKNFDEALPFIRTALICANAVNMFTRSEMTDAMKLMYEKYQSGFYQKLHIDKKAMPLYQGYMVLSNLANMFTLALNPVSFVREMLTGRYNNFGRLMTKFAGKNMPSEADLVWAYTFVDASGAEALFQQNLMNAFNMRYNIGGRAIQEMKESHRALRNPLLGTLFRSGALYTMNQLPDYEHRMAFFLAYMKKEKCMEAYSYNKETQQLEYNFEKDSRFKAVKEVKKTGKIPAGENNNIAKYQMMIEEFNKDLPNDLKLIFGDPLPDGITEAQVKTIKNISNLIHGNMDTDTAMHARNYFWGKVFLKFQTFISAKALNYTLTPNKYLQKDEQYAYDEITGLPLYLKIVKDPETGEITMEETTDYNDPLCTKLPVIRLQDRQEAGTWYALKEVYEILTDPKKRSSKDALNELMEDESKMAGLKFMIGDLFMLLFGSILTAALGINELRQENPFAGDLLNSAINTTRENNPIVLLSGALSVVDPSAFNINKKVFNNTIRFLTTDNYESEKYLYRTFGAGKMVSGLFSE